MHKRIFLTFLMAAILLSACGQAEPPLDPNAAMTQAFATVNAAFTQTALAVPTNTLAPAETATPTAPPKPGAFEPTAILSVTVNTGVAWCRFGPDPVYVARFGLRFGKTLEAIGRTEAGDWLLVREVGGGAKGCWTSASLMTVQGDIFSLAVAPVVWVTTQKYPPPSNVAATRAGDQVQISWSDVTIEKSDIYTEGRFLLEVWLCNGGVLASSLVGTKDLTLTLTDQTGCAEPSHGQIYTATRDGYSLPAPIPWP